MAMKSDFLKKLLSDACITTMLIALLIGVIIFFPLSIIYFIHTLDFSIIVSLCKAFVLLSGLLSGADYLGKTIGLTYPFLKCIFLKAAGRESVDSNTLEKSCDGENIGAAIGIVLLGAVLGPISFLVFHEAIEYHTAEGMILFVFSYFSAYGGISNRIGRGVIDRALQNLRDKKVPVNYAYGIRGGLFLSLILIALLLLFGHFVVPVFPLLLASIVTIGLCVSFSGYIGRIFDWVFDEDASLYSLLTVPHKRENALNWKNFTERFQYKRLGTCIGLLLGLLLATALIIAGVSLCPPLLAAGIPFIIKAYVTGGLTVIACASIGMGLGTRIGAIIDHFSDTNKTPANAIAPSASDKSTPSYEPLPPVDMSSNSTMPENAPEQKPIETEEISSTKISASPQADLPAIKNFPENLPSAIETKKTKENTGNINTGKKLSKGYNHLGLFKVQKVEGKQLLCPLIAMPFKTLTLSRC